MLVWTGVVGIVLGGTYGGGSGTDLQPYQIWTAEQMHEIGLREEDWDKHFRLMVDIDLAGRVYRKALIAPLDTDDIWEFTGPVFGGVFDGNNYAIKNLTIDTAGENNSFLGLFGIIEGENAKVQNLRLLNVSITAGNDGSYIGGLCGTNGSEERLEGGTIRNCGVIGAIKCGDNCSFFGLLCGYNGGHIISCYSAGIVEGDNGAGYLGGLCGKHEDFRNNASIRNSYTTASVRGGFNSWGLGGLCGCMESGDAIINCYGTGSVSGMAGSEDIGGLCGRYICGTIRNCYFLDTSGPDNGYGTPLTDSQMRQQASFVGWDFIGETANGTDDIWRLCGDSLKYPGLAWEYVRIGDFACPDGVSMEDLSYYASQWLMNNCATDNYYCGGADLNHSGVVDLADWGMLAANWLAGGEGNDMVPIPAGTFQMGDSFSEGNARERPVHTVTLSSFYMSKHETSNAQYCQFLNSALAQELITVNSGVVYKAGSGTTFPYCDTSTSSQYSQIAFSNNSFTVRTKGGRRMVNDPMVVVSWYGAVAYCNWRSQQEGLEPCYKLSTWACDFSKNGYRLPTEAQWEYAARGGLSGKRFPWGDTITHSHANYYSRSDYSYDTSPTRGYHPTWNDGIMPYTSPVGSFTPNGYGLYDMVGNVVEWCNDWYSGTYYGSSPETNPTGPLTGNFRVLRGGSWYDLARSCRVAYRPYGTPVIRYGVGFRVCR